MDATNLLHPVLLSPCCCTGIQAGAAAARAVLGTFLCVWGVTQALHSSLLLEGMLAGEGVTLLGRGLLGHILGAVVSPLCALRAV